MILLVAAFCLSSTGCDLLVVAINPETKLYHGRHAFISHSVTVMSKKPHMLLKYLPRVD